MRGENQLFLFGTLQEDRDIEVLEVLLDRFSCRGEELVDVER